MFYGQWNGAVEARKWRLTLPADFSQFLSAQVFLNLDENDCVRILVSESEIPQEEAPFHFLTKVERTASQTRILIPEKLRSSNSFFFGRTITLAGRGEFIEIWPRPK